jgi:hypothetical protein
MSRSPKYSRLFAFSIQHNFRHYPLSGHFPLKHDVSKTGFGLCLQEEPTQIVPMSVCMPNSGQDDEQCQNRDSCITVASSQTHR